MPHFVMEYSRNIEETTNLQNLCETIHHFACNTDLFRESTIKVRAKPFDYFTVAGKHDKFIHITIYLLSGRSEETKKTLTEGTVKLLKQKIKDTSSVTVNAVDMLPSVYSK